MQSGNPSVPARREIAVLIKSLLSEVTWELFLDDNFQNMPQVKYFSELLIQYLQLTFAQTTGNQRDNSRFNLLAFITAILNGNSKPTSIDVTELRQLKDDIDNNLALLLQELLSAADRQTFMDDVTSLVASNFPRFILLDNLTPCTMLLGVNDETIFMELEADDDYNREVRRNDMDLKLICFLQEYKKYHTIVSITEKNKYTYYTMLSRFVDSLLTETFNLTHDLARSYDLHQTAFNYINYAVLQAEVLNALQFNNSEQLLKCKLTRLNIINLYALDIMPIRNLEALNLFYSIRKDLANIQKDYPGDPDVNKLEARFNYHYSLSLRELKRQIKPSPELGLKMARKIAKLSYIDKMTHLVMQVELLETLALSNSPTDILESQNLLSKTLKRLKRLEKSGKRNYLVLIRLYRNFLITLGRLLPNINDASVALRLVTEMRDGITAIPYTIWHQYVSDTEDRNNYIFLRKQCDRFYSSTERLEIELHYALLQLIVAAMNVIPKEYRTNVDGLNYSTLRNDSHLLTYKLVARFTNEHETVYMLVKNDFAAASTMENYLHADNDDSVISNEFLGYMQTDYYRVTVKQYLHYIQANQTKDNILCIRLYLLLLEQFAKISSVHRQNSDLDTQILLSRNYIQHIYRLIAIADYSHNHLSEHLLFFRIAFREFTHIPFAYIKTEDRKRISFIFYRLQPLIISIISLCKEVLRQTSHDLPDCITAINEEFIRLQMTGILLNSEKYLILQPLIAHLLEVKNDYKTLNAYLVEYINQSQNQTFREREQTLKQIIDLYSAETPVTDVTAYNISLFHYYYIKAQTELTGYLCLSPDSNGLPVCVTEFQNTLAAHVKIRARARCQVYTRIQVLMDLTDSLHRIEPFIEDPLVLLRLGKGLCDEYINYLFHPADTAQIVYFRNDVRRIAFLLDANTSKLAGKPEQLLQSYQVIRIGLLSLPIQNRLPADVVFLFRVQTHAISLAISMVRDYLHDFAEVTKTLKRVIFDDEIYLSGNPEKKHYEKYLNNKYIRFLTSQLFILIDHYAGNNQALSYVADIAFTARQWFLKIVKMTDDDLELVIYYDRRVMLHTLTYLNYLDNSDSLALEANTITYLEIAVKSFHNIRDEKITDEDIGQYRQLKNIFNKLSCKAILLAQQEVSQRAPAEKKSTVSLLFTQARSEVTSTECATLEEVFNAIKKLRRKLSESDKGLAVTDSDAKSECSEYSIQSCMESDDEDELSQIYQNLWMLRDINQIIAIDYTSEKESEALMVRNFR
jgi:hypothetical protein